MINETAYLLGTNRSCIRQLYEYGRARAEVVGRENVYDFSLGNPSIPAPPQVQEAILSVVRELPPQQLHGYTTAAGDEDTRKAIADDLNRRYDANVQPGQLFIGCGAAPALTAVFKALAVENGEILAIAPYFPEYKPFAEGAGLKFSVVPADVPGFQIDLQALAEKITAHTVAVIVNSPNNPSGAVYSHRTLAALAALLRKKEVQFGHSIYIVSDEPYRELTYGCEVPFIPQIYENTVVCYSYSKSLSLPGERIGYVYVPAAAADSERLLAAIAGAARSMGHVCAPSLWQKVIARCAHLRPDLESYDANRRLLAQSLTQMGYEMAPPMGAFYLFVKAPGGDALAFMERAKKEDLLVVPGDGFGCPGYFRLCYCVSREQIQSSLPVFRKLLQADM